MDRDDKHWAQKYLIDPLTQPDPSDETGPGSSFVVKPNGAAPSTVSKNSTGGSSSNPFRRSMPSTIKDNGTRVRSSSLRSSTSMNTTAVGSGYPSGPPPSYKATQFGADSSSPWQRRSADEVRPATSDGTGNLRRGSSLRERYPGDKSLHPLDQIKRENRRANRAPHLQKRHQPKRDSIDRLDNIGVPGASYHHEGPYDAALFTRNSSYENSPVAAVKEGNDKALKATPQDKIHDSLYSHMPLDGTAAFPPGAIDPLGRRYSYEEGDNLQIDGAGIDAYARWPGVTYRKDDYKGKGEPGWDEGVSRRNYAKEANSRPGVIELVDSPRKNSGSAGSSSHDHGSGQQSYVEWEQHRKEGRFSGELKRRFGSLRRTQQA